MSTQLNPDAHEQQHIDIGQSQLTQSSVPNVAASLAKFWDTVRTSAELIVTLRQEVVQLRAQNASLEVELLNALESAGAQADESAMAELTDTVARLESDLAQARVELCEYELQASAKDAEQQKVNDQLYLMHQRCEELAGLVSEVRAENQQLQSNTQGSVAELQAINEALEHKLTAATLDAAEVRSTMERMKTEKTQLNDDYHLLADRYQGIEQQVANLQAALAAAEQELAAASSNEQPAIIQEDALELEALRKRLSDLELMAKGAAESEAVVVKLQEDIEDLQQQLTKAMGIVELYRAAGLRHVEDPDLRNQISLFQTAPVSEASIELLCQQDRANGLSQEEMHALAEKLDNLASRVAHLLGIS
jgi:predicted nuclease with TOPRIM domain